VKLRLIESGKTAALARVKTLNARTDARRARWRRLVALTTGLPVANDNHPSVPRQPRWHTEVQSSWAKRVAQLAPVRSTATNIIPFRRPLARSASVLVEPLGLPVQLDCASTAITLLTNNAATPLDLAQARKLGRYLVAIADAETRR
jgi:hypothetical protein